MGRLSESARGRNKHAGVWFAELFNVSGAHGRKSSAQVEVTEGSFDKGHGRRARHRHGAYRTRQIDGALRAGHQHAFRFHQVAHALQNLRHDVGATRTRPRETLEPILHHLGHEHALGVPGVIENGGDAQVTQNFRFRLVPENFGINQEAIHVKQGGAQHRRLRPRRRRCPRLTAGHSARHAGCSDESPGRPHR